MDAAFVTNEIPVISMTATHDFESFYRRERPSVARALRLTLRDDQLADEATDEAMTRAYERWHSVSRLDNPGGWAYRVGLNWSRSVLRRRMRRRHEPLAPPFADAPQAPDFELHHALARLDVDQRSVVVCRYFLQWTELETAQALDIRPGTVKSRLHRALRELERRLTPTPRFVEGGTARPAGRERDGADTGEHGADARESDEGFR